VRSSVGAGGVGVASVGAGGVGVAGERFGMVTSGILSAISS
jgi:hypothetical protein